MELTTVVAIYCPLWHRYDHMDAWMGEGWSEWELLRTAPARFRGHHQPLRPTWGCFDESDPRWSAKEIALAADHGIDVFLFDWYWYNGVKIMEKALERGFLQAPNRRRLRFALMWANHPWFELWPMPYGKLPTFLLPARHSPPDLNRVMDYCAEHYFRQPNYWRLDGKLFFSVFYPLPFTNRLGGAAKTRRLLREINRRLGDEIHWNAMTWDTKHVDTFKAAGFETTTRYNVNTTGKIGPRDEPLEQYPDIMAQHRSWWRRMSAQPLPHLPVVTMGWDVSPRARHDIKWPFPPAPGQKQRKYPYMHIVVGNTPERFEQLCRDTRAHLEKTKTPYRVVFVNAWNEWTEGCYLLPEKKHGDAYLNAVRRVFA